MNCCQLLRLKLDCLHSKQPQQLLQANPTPIVHPKVDFAMLQVVDVIEPLNDSRILIEVVDY